MSGPPDPFAMAETAAAALLERTGSRPETAIILGSGWGEAMRIVGEPTTSIPAEDLPGFVPPTVPGHGGQIHTVDLDGHHLLMFQGRSHLYEGHGPAVVAHPVRTAIAAGCSQLVITNACGGIREGLQVGQLVLISDHLNLTGHSPLAGPPPPDPYPIRFTDLTDAYSPRLIAAARRVDSALNDGVYAGLGGPHFETPAEIRMLRSLGADLVGMSTVTEVIAARHLGAEVLGLSLVTNLAAGMSGASLDHEEVLDAGAEAGGRLGDFLRGVCLEMAPAQ